MSPDRYVRCLVMAAGLTMTATSIGALEPLTPAIKRAGELGAALTAASRAIADQELSGIEHANGQIYRAWSERREMMIVVEYGEPLEGPGTPPSVEAGIMASSCR